MIGSIVLKVVPQRLLRPTISFLYSNLKFKMKCYTFYTYLRNDNLKCTNSNDKNNKVDGLIIMPKFKHVIVVGHLCHADLWGGGSLLSLYASNGLLAPGDHPSSLLSLFISTWPCEHVHLEHWLSQENAKLGHKKIQYAILCSKCLFNWKCFRIFHI